MQSVILVGGGLANGLVALHLLAQRPGTQVFLLERERALGGNHTWSFHRDDVSEATFTLLEPWLKMSWPGHTVAFPNRTRRLPRSYHSLSSENLSAAILDTMGDRVLLGSEVQEVRPHEVVLAGGQTLEADAVIDGRGLRQVPFPSGYQKFVGLDVALERDHGLSEPVLMDATVPQLGGFRFVYLLPWDERRLLVEDTYYTNGPELDRDVIRSEIRAYAARRGWRVDRVEREEVGVLPIPLGGDLYDLWPPSSEVPRVGMAAGLFHATTGYSLTYASRTAEEIARAPELESEPLYQLTRRIAHQAWRQAWFFRFLNRMLLLGAEPEERVYVLERFYGLSEGLIGRFYAGTLSLTDQARILCGKPPIPLSRAVRCVAEPASVSQESRETKEVLDA